MAKIKFPGGENFDIDNEFVNNTNYTNLSTIDKITNNLLLYLDFISNNKLIPELPSIIEIKYVKENKFPLFLGKILNKYPKDYAYPASMNPATSTLYISEDFNKENKKISKLKNGIETNDIVLFRQYFNHDNEKALEYTFGHELGHFFLLTKNYAKQNLPDNTIVQRISRNIEEGFAEAFSMQLMCLKEPSLDFNYVKLNRQQDSNRRLANIESSHLKSQEMLNYFEQIGFEKLIDTYNFKTIYSKLPIKNSNGDIEKDINKIYDKCFEIALDNNKEIILDIINNPQLQKFHLSQTFHNLLKASLNTKENDTTQLIKEIHNQINGMSLAIPIIM